MADINQKINIKEIVDVSDALKGIKQIQDSLSHLKVGAEAKASFDRLFSNIQQQAEKANAALATGFKNKGDVDKYKNAMGQIVTNYDEIIRRIEVLKTKDISLDVDVKKLEKAKQDIKDFTTQVDQAQKAAGKFLKDSSRTLQSDIGKDRKGQDKWEKVLQAYKDGKIGEAAKALGVLKAAMTRAGKNGEDLNSEEWVKYAEDIKEIQIALDTYKAKIKDVDDAQQGLTTSLDAQSQVYDDAKKALDGIGQAATDDAKDVRDFAKATSESAQEAQHLSSELEQFRNKAAYFFGISNAINLFKRALRSAYDTVKDLDAVMTETAVVTNFDVGDMWDQLPEYTQRANELGVSIHSAYEAATIFYQQGLKTNEVMAVSNETLKMARIAGLDAATASDRMTNALRGFNMEMDKMSAQRVNDVYSKLAAITASDTDEISTAMTKVASLAHNANMEFETTAAFLAQIIESTRESAETAGTALKTVVARFSEVKNLYSKGELLGQDEEGEEIDVNRVSTALRSAGINLNEYLTGAKGLDDIFMELAEKWNDLDIVQQRYIATMAAGSRQQSRFIALMSDYKRTVELVDAANNANGASQEQYGKTLESLETKLSRLKNAWNEFVLGLANSDAIKGAVDLLTNLITAINKLISSISGKNSGVKMVTTFFTAFTGFRIGQKMFGGTEIGKFFEGLVKTGNGEAAKGGLTIARTFYANLANEIANKRKSGSGGNAIEQAAKDLYKYFNPASSANVGLASGITTDKALTNIVNKFDTTVTNEAIQKFRAEVGPALEQGTITTNQLNEAIEKTGQSIRVTGKNAGDLGLVLKDTNGEIDNSAVQMRQFSAAAMAAGGVMMALGTWMEEMEGPAQVLGTVIKGLGAGLLAFGTIMSVYLPLQAQLMAKEVTGAIVSIPIVGWIAGVISALIALGVAISSYVKNNSAETKLERASEAAKAAADAANEAKEAYEKLNESLSSLDDKYQAIENATKGTREWRDAIKETNAAVLELLNNYDGIEIERNEDGTLSITPESQKELEDKMRKNADTTAAYERVANIREYENEINTRHAALQQTRTNGRYEMSHGEPVDELLLDYEGRLEELGNMDSAKIKGLLKGTYAYADKINYDLDEGVREVFDYINQYENNINAIESEKTALGSIFLQSAEIDEDLQKYANTLLNNNYTSNLIEKNKQIYEDRNLSKGKLRTEVANLSGKTWQQFVKENPEFKEYTKSQLQDYLATNAALEEVNGQLRTFVNNLDNLTGNEKALLEQPEGGALSRNQINDLRANREGLFDKLGGADVFGSEEAFNKWLDETLDTALNSFDISKYGEKFSSILGSSFDYISKDFDANTYKAFTDNLFSIYTISGEEGLEKIKHTFFRLTSELDPDEVDDFVKGLNNLDWASVNSLEDLDDLAEEFGISEEAMEGFKNQIIELNNAATSIDLEKLGSVLGLVKKIQNGEQGRSFSEEDYKNLIEHGVSSEDFQFNIETGNYDYIGQNLESISNIVEDYFKTATTSLEKQVASNEAIERIRERGKLPTDENDVGQVKDFLTYYNNLAGKDSFVSKDFIDSATEEQILAKYNEIMDAFAVRADTQATLDQAYAYNYQTKSGAELAGLANGGDEQAADNLKQQIVNSGLSEAIIQGLLEDVESGEAKRVSSAGGVVDTTREANAYGISPEDLENYVTALRTVDDLQGAEEATLYALALANAKYQEGFKSVIESYDEWIQLKQEDGSIQAEDGNAEQLQAFAQLKKDLKEMFNLTEDVSDEFLKSAENVELLEKAVDGDTDAVSELRANLAKSQLIDLGIDPNSEIFEQVNEVMAEAGTLEFGADLDAAPAMQKLKELMEASGFTVDQMAKIFNAFGWAPEVSMKEVPVTEAMSYGTEGQVEVVDPITGEKTVVTADNIWQHSQDGMVLIPEIGNATFTPPEIPSFTPSTKDSGGGGGGGGKTEKPSYWENPYDELYNLQEKINEALRTREALERRYQKLLKEEKATLSDIRKAYYSQINNLRAEADLQKQFAAGRLRQIQNIGEQMYTDSEGDRSSFNSWGVTKYASYDANTGLIQIDWNGLEEIANDSDREEEGKAAEAYISKLEELTSSYEEVRDKLWEIEDEIENLREAAIESYLSFEDRVLEALVNSYQQQIDSYQAMSDSLEKASNEVLTSLREQVELSRQIRDNTDKEKQIADMENRLAYLQRDTSGSNALEIQKLQKDLEDARESYTDTLVDQAIEKMQNEADLAAEQRARQIETMQEQLEIMKDTGALWQQVYDLMDEAAEGNGALSPKTTLVELLKDTEAFTSLSNIGQAKWWSEVAEEFHAAWVGRDEAEDKYKTDANNDGIIANSGTSAAISSVSATADSVSPTSSSSSSSSGPSDADEAGVAMNICGPNNGWGNGETRRNRLEEKGFDYWSVQSIVNDIVNSGWDDSYYRRKYGISDLSDYSYYAFKTGGLADFTGPAWLDGTKAKPELILNAQDSANFIALKDILASLLNVQGGGLNGTKNGDNYFDIDISANIGSDYDVDRLAERLKQNIYNDGQYRNVNTINFLR